MSRPWAARVYKPSWAMTTVLLVDGGLLFRRQVTPAGPDTRSVSTKETVIGAVYQPLLPSLGAVL